MIVNLQVDVQKSIEIFGGQPQKFNLSKNNKFNVASGPKVQHFLFSNTI